MHVYATPKVTLLAHTEHPEKIISAAAKLCYSSAAISNIFEGLTPEKTDSFIDMLMDLGHQSPLEHVAFTFGIENVSRALLAQITRHRIASYSVQSQRYVKENNFSFVIPPEIEKNPSAKKEFLQAMQEDIQHYNNLVDILIDQYKNDSIDVKSIEKKAIEDARFVLPNACTTKMICTFNARSLLNFFKVRCCNRAQWEIRDVANQMLTLCRGVAPKIFKKAGAPCANGFCPEGKMSCRKIGWK